MYCFIVKFFICFRASDEMCQYTILITVSFHFIHILWLPVTTGHITSDYISQVYIHTCMKL